MSSKNVKENIKKIMNSKKILRWTKLANLDQYHHLTINKAIELVNDPKYFDSKTRILNLSETHFEVIDEFCFHSLDIKEVIFPLNLVIIAKYAFANNDLEKVNLTKSNKLEIIEDYSFAYNKINDFEFSNSVIVLTNKALFANPCYNNKFKN